MFFSACRSEQKFVRCFVPEKRENNAITSQCATLSFFVRESKLCFYSPGNSKNQFAVLVKNQSTSVPSYSVEFMQAELDENNSFNSIPQCIASEKLKSFTQSNGGVEVQSTSYESHINTAAIPAVSLYELNITSLLFQHPNRARHIRGVVCYDDDVIVALDYWRGLECGLELRILPNVMQEVSTLYAELDPLPRAAMDTYFQHSNLNDKNPYSATF
jgi:hypothetical protein